MVLSYHEVSLLLHELAARTKSTSAEDPNSRVGSIIERAFQDVSFRTTKASDQADRYETALRDIRNIVARRGRQS